MKIPVLSFSLNRTLDIESPEYVVFVSMNKEGFPAGRAIMTGRVFGQIVEYMVDSDF